MFTVLPLLNLVLLFGVVHRQGEDWRRSLLSASVIWGVEVTAITELLNLGNAITFPGLLLAWAIATVIVGLLCWQIHGRKLNARLKTAGLGELGKKLGVFLRQPTTFAWFCGGGMGAIALLLLLVAVVCPSNNWDSMRYHMTRVVHWMQNQNVNHYPTAMLHQVDQPPWNSFAILQLQVLSGGDRFANLVQWTCAVGCAIGVSLIARYLRANLVGQVLAAVFYFTIPTGLLQATSTQNDLIISFWLVCFVNQVLLITHPTFANSELATSAKNRVSPAVLRCTLELGASFGLALLTKGTAYVFGLPLILWAAWLVFAKMHWQIWRIALPSALVAIGLNVGHWWRNLTVLGSPLGFAGDTTRNQLFTLPAVISNVLRNLALHLPTISPNVNRTLEALITQIHVFMGLEVSHPLTTARGQTFGVPPYGFSPIYLHDSYSGNPLHLILILLCIAVYLVRPKLWNQRLSKYLVAVVLGFLCYCLLIRWQMWAPRLHTPLFVLFSPVVGTVFSQSLTAPFLRYGLAGLLLFSAVPYTLFNSTRPLIVNAQVSQHFLLFPPASILNLPRMDLYFANRWNVKDPFYAIADRIQADTCRQVGLDVNWEYPLWMILRSHEQPNTPPHIFKSIVSRLPPNAPTNQPSRDFIPCAIVRLVNDPRKPLPPEYQTYRLDWQANPDPDVYLQLLK